MSDYKKVQWIFLQNTDSLSNGASFIADGDISLATIEIIGTGTNKVIFEGRVINGGDFHPISGVNMTNLTMAYETTLKDVIYQIPLTGIIEFRVRVSEYTDGAITVKGLLVS